jgi:alginate O-acetyltransferase complex protein AlgI
MLLPTILAFSALSIALRLLLKARARGWALLAACALAVYLFQPSTPIRYLDFWLPTATLVLVFFAWIVTTPAEARGGRENLWAALLLAGVVSAVALTRYLAPSGVIIPGRPPQIGTVAVALLLAVLLAWLVMRVRRAEGMLLSVGIFLIVLLFLELKIPALTQSASAGLRLLAGQSTALASAADIRWLGFSYIAFRLIHTMRDRQTGRLPVVNLREYVTYAVFFPALTAGPIDRLERFTPQLRQPAPFDLVPGMQRLLLGLFKKFVLADSLALIALNPLNAAQVESIGWSWLLLYAFSLQIFFDFAGYTDIAIGMALFLGIRLPENFNRPYSRANLTQFWNNWHMTLTQWFRAYFFNPLARGLRGGRVKLSPPVVILIAQVLTMVLIGLWHGVTVNFAFWGLWHGVGLFVQNRWSAWIAPRVASHLIQRPAWQSVLSAAGVLLTFHYVTLGWVWFALPEPALAWDVLRRLLWLG